MQILNVNSSRRVYEENWLELHVGEKKLMECFHIADDATDFGFNTIATAAAVVKKGFYSLT